ncbi:MAG: 50S ribosomal protein L25 [Chloroflexota bacterium]
MADITLNAERRTLKGKQVRALRRQDIIPANIYGRGIESVAVQFRLRALRDLLIQAGTTSIVDVHVHDPAGGSDGESHPVLVERVSRHPASGKVLHVDLRHIDLNRPVRAAVPIRLVGEAPAVNLGGVLVHPLDTIEVEALPRSLPRVIEVDISALADLDSQITVGDLQLPPGVTTNAAPESVVAHVVTSRLEQEVAAEEAAAAEAAEEVEAPEAAPEAAESTEAGAGGEEAASESA